ncbi:PfkB family carbohydrate kinase [Cytobacillus gottheilii]|uniref:PfkB family carbohydrate kinase n=1 Tax=Cytobacillus gottheilii TaxID=859144 RepID=UPI0008323FE3|nr:PfkB family carbohydrate kinase [Cytobacillus gottheilii]
MKLIAIGDNVVDCYLDQDIYYPGGNCVNVAVNARRNGAEQVSYIGIFGNDEKADHIKYALKQEEVDFQHARTVMGISGQPRVTLKHGDRIFIGGPKNTVQRMFKLQLTDDELDYISKFDLCHVSCYSSMESELEKLSKVIKISYDFSSRKELDYIRSIAPYIQYAFFSAAELTEAELTVFIEELTALPFEIFAITRGSEPALFFQNGVQYEQKINPISIVDTMGAGDSLIAGFLVNYINGDSMASAIDKATLSAEKTCGMYGGFGYPKKM